MDISTPLGSSKYEDKKHQIEAVDEKGNTSLHECSGFVAIFVALLAGVVDEMRTWPCVSLTSSAGRVGVISMGVPILVRKGKA